MCELREICEEKIASLSEVVVEGLRYEDERRQYSERYLNVERFGLERYRGQ
jgi:hypothetical protein